MNTFRLRLEHMASYDWKPTPADDAAAAHEKSAAEGMFSYPKAARWQDEMTDAGMMLPVELVETDGGDGDAIMVDGLLGTPSD